ncbi:MAG: insulinase family protein [Mariprofundaceae bacterium]|nr:insulinase family protein [Mariprofundaceae bacterium]
MKKNLLIHLTILLLGYLSFTSPAHAIPPIEEARMENGLRILLMEAHAVPMVSMQLLLPAGSRFDPVGKGGTASLLAAMLSDHTEKHAHEAWAAVLDAEAIQLGAGSSHDGFNLSLTVLKEALPTGINAFSEALLTPGWNRERFALIKENSLSAARKSLEEPGVRASEATSRLLFPGHPYGHRPDGNPESLKKVLLADLKKLYADQIKPKGAVLAVSGDITMPELLELLKPAVAGWKGAPGQPLFEISRADSVSGITEQIEMQTSQTLSQLIRLGPARRDADFFPAFVLNHILGGGGFGSRLMEEVREKRGLVYGVYSYFIPLATSGPFIITLQTRADQAEEAEGVVRSVLQQLFSGEISRKELKDAKANLTGSFAQRMDSNRERVGLMSMIGFYDMPLDYLQAWTQKVESVTLADIKVAANAYLDPKQWNLLRVGPKAGVEAGGETSP